MSYDFPVPPHHFKDFDTPDAMQPPNLKRLSKSNDHFYAFQGLETFRDEHERIFPDYLQLLPEKTDLSVPGLSLKENLVSMVNELHRCCTAYIRAFAEDPQSLKDIRLRLDAIIFNTFWTLKKIRVKLEVV